MHITFTAAPLDGSLTFPQLLDRQLAQSPHHTAYIYDAPDGEIISISFTQYIRTVYAACRRISRETASNRPDGQSIVVGIFATAGMMVAAIMRAGLVPFCISPGMPVLGVANLLEKTGTAAVYVSPDLKNILMEAFEICGMQLPLQDGLGEDESEALPTMINSSGMILHSSGEQSVHRRAEFNLFIPDYSHTMILQYALVPWSSPEDHCGQIMICHGIGVFLLTWPFSTGVIVAVLRPTMPATPAAIIATRPDIVLASPAFIEALHRLSYIGASLNKHFNAVRVPEEDGSELYTHTYLVSPSYEMCWTNTEIGGKPASRQPDLHRIFGRKDDLINFSTAAKMNPVPIEAQINRNPLIDAALIFGHGRRHPGVLIQLKSEFQRLVLDVLRASIDDIPRKMVLLADPQKPFALTSKSLPRRRVVFEHYAEEISAAYL
ncbi:hypothetical protein B0H13DRAFT_2119469 [Mycena leptocephala]|nr:hypothetical protein B0H13DRAFT_2119469 [Mycena leptocephala]